MSDGPDLTNSPRRKPQPAPDSGIHPADVAPEKSTPGQRASKPATQSAANLPVKARPEPKVQMGLKVKPSLRDRMEQIKSERGFTFEEIVELGVLGYWGDGK